MPNAQFDDEEIVIARSSTPKPPNSTDLDADFGDQDVVHTGDGLDRIVPADKNSKVRVAVLTQIVKPKMAWVHFIQSGDKKSVYRCLTVRDRKHVVVGELADCCKKLNHDQDQQAQVVFATLAVKYTNADQSTGKYPKQGPGESATPIKWELGWIKLSRAGFKSVSELVQEDETASDFDFAIGHRENKIGYTYSRVSKNSPRYRTNPQVEKEILAEAAKYADGVVLTNRLGKVVSVVDMKAILAGKSVAVAGKNSNIDDTSDLD